MFRLGKPARPRRALAEGHGEGFDAQGAVEPEERQLHKSSPHTDRESESMGSNMSTDFPILSARQS